MLSPDDRVVIYMRPGCHVCARVKNFLTEHEVPFTARDVDSDPLTPRELWELLNRKADRLRVPFTALNDGEDVVLGFDPQRLEGVFVHGELGGVQPSSAVTTPLVYDEFVTPELDKALWGSDSRGRADDLSDKDGHDVATGQGQLRISCPANGGQPCSARPVRRTSTRRFGTPPGVLVSFELDMVFEADPHMGQSLDCPRGEIGLRDLPTGMLLGFEVSNGTILAVHQRCQLPGVVADAEQFSHRLISDIETKPGQLHRYRISYQHDTSRARWYVDDRCVYAAIVPLQIEGVSLGMGLLCGLVSGAAQATQRHASATWRPWNITAD